MNARKVLCPSIAPLFAGLLLWTSPTAATPPSFAHAPVVSHSQRNDVSLPLTSLSRHEPPDAPVFREIPRHPLPRRGPKLPGGDPALQSTQTGPAMPSAATSFDGVGNVDLVIPPDPNGAIGPNHYVQWVNLSFAIYHKSGALLYGPVSGNTLWFGFGGPCETTNDGDPIVLYDRLAGRWFMSQFALPNYPSGPFYQCIAVSLTDDPTGAFYRYQFTISNTKLNDYPKFGVWPDAYYMAVNQFADSSWGGQGVVAFERAQMLIGQPARMVYFDLFAVDSNLGGMLPSDADSPPPAGTPNYFVQVDDNTWGYSPDQLQIWEFSVLWGATATGTFTKVAALPTAAFDSNLCGYARSCIPQAGTTSKVDALSDRLMYRLQFRQVAGGASLVTNHTVDVDGTDHAGIRWYELRHSVSGWSIAQQGTFAPDSNHRWMGSIAMDKAGNMALGYSVSSGGMFPAIRYTGRLAGDPAGTMTQGETTLVAGSGSQTSGSSRWGDYSLMAVDPSDGCTFWYTQEYYAATSTMGWRTRIGSFKFPSCGGTGPTASADVSITKTASLTPVVGSDMTYTLTAKNNGPDGATDVIVTDTLPGQVTFKSATPSSGSCVGNPSVVCAVGFLAAAAIATVSIVVTPTVGGSISNTAGVSATESDPAPGNNSATLSTTVGQLPAGAPVVNGCNPATGNRGQTLFVDVTGSNFRRGATTNFGSKIWVQGVTFVRSSKLTVRIKVNSQAVSGPRTVTVTNPDTQRGRKSGCFTVN